MLMASDQRRKRLNGAIMVGYGSLEQYRTKRKNFGLPVQGELHPDSYQEQHHVSNTTVNSAIHTSMTNDFSSLTFQIISPYINQ